MTEDPESPHPRVMVTPVSFTNLAPDDLKQLRSQAAGLAARFENSGG